MGSIIVQTLSKAFLKVVTFSGILDVRGRPVDFRFHADPVALKLVTYNKIVFQTGTGLCLSKLKRKRNARCVAVTDSFTLINVSRMKARRSLVQFMAANEKMSNGSKKKTTKNNGI